MYKRVIIKWVHWTETLTLSSKSLVLYHHGLWEEITSSCVLGSLRPSPPSTVITRASRYHTRDATHSLLDTEKLAKRGFFNTRSENKVHPENTSLEESRGVIGEKIIPREIRTGANSKECTMLQEPLRKCKEQGRYVAGQRQRM